MDLMPSMHVQIQVHNQLNGHQGFYCIIPTGMGCMWFAKNMNQELRYFFMHSDDWGQYGDTTVRNKLDIFLTGMIRLETN